MEEDLPEEEEEEEEEEEDYKRSVFEGFERGNRLWSGKGVSEGPGDCRGFREEEDLEDTDEGLLERWFEGETQVKSVTRESVVHKTTKEASKLKLLGSEASSALLRPRQTVPFIDEEDEDEDKLGFPYRRGPPSPYPPDESPDEALIDRWFESDVPTTPQPPATGEERPDDDYWGPNNNLLLPLIPDRDPYTPLGGSASEEVLSDTLKEHTPEEEEEEEEEEDIWPVRFAASPQPPNPEIVIDLCPETTEGNTHPIQRPHRVVTVPENTSEGVTNVGEGQVSKGDREVSPVHPQPKGDPQEAHQNKEFDIFGGGTKALSGALTLDPPEPPHAPRPPRHSRKEDAKGDKENKESVDRWKKEEGGGRETWEIVVMSSPLPSPHIPSPCFPLIHLPFSPSLSLLLLFLLQ